MIPDKKDKRLEDLMQQLSSYSKFDFQPRGIVSGKGDEIDALITGLNKLGEDLISKTGSVKINEDRINTLLDILLKYTIMDFSERMPVSKKADEIDAIAAGVNTLIEELSYRTEKIKESEEQHRLLLNNIKEYAIFLLDPKGFITTWNRAAEYVKGYSAEEIIGKHISIFYTPDELERGEPEYNLKTAKEKGRFETEGWRVRKDGSLFWADISFTSLYDSSGNLKGFSKVTRDVTARKLAQDELKDREEQLQTIINNAPDAIMVIDSNGTVMKWNPWAESMFGWSSEETVGKPLHEFIIPQRYREAHQRGMEHFLKTGEGRVINKTIEIEALTKKGKEINIALSISSPILVKGTYLFIGFAADITERKKAEQELRQKTEELARSNQELEQFAYVASHDLQEPLRMITSYVQLLASRYKDKLDKDANEFIDFAVDGSNRMRTLIKSLLEYSRINRIKPFEFIDLDDLLKDVLQNLSSQIKEANAIIKLEKMPVIYGDAVLMGQLFQNLITNAIKFKGEKDPQIEISYKKENKHYLFSVKDNGIGIQKEYVNKIFVIFQRLHRKDQYPGTGIGLAICKKIVERHQGKIWVESELGKGSTFYFTIPEKNT